MRFLKNGRRLALVAMVVLFARAAAAQTLAVTGGWLVDVEAGVAVPNPGINVVAGKIHSLGKPAGDVPTVVLAKDDYVLPGLIDLHAHYRIAYKGQVEFDTGATPLLFLANGVTTTFTGGEINPEVALELKHRINRGEAIGPRILNTGPYFGKANPSWNPEYTREDIYNIVDTWAAKGVAGFKAKAISKTHLGYLIERAHAHDLTVTAHLNSGWDDRVNSDDAIDMGIDRVEHFLGGAMLPDDRHAYYGLAELDLEDPRVDAIMDKYIRHGVYLDATLGTYGAWSGSDADAYDYWRDESKYLTPHTASFFADLPYSDIVEVIDDVFRVNGLLLKRYHDRGGRVTLGTDRPLTLDSSLGPYINGFFVHRELQVIANTGISNADVLRIATINGAQAMNLASSRGTIDVGKLADLMVIKGNPLEDIRHTRSVHTVVKGGVVYDSETLLQQAEGRLGPVAPSGWPGE